MPIGFLQHIKLSISPNSELIAEHEVHDTQSRRESISSIYVFSCKDLKRIQPLFNDGLPSIIFMQKKNDRVQLRHKAEIIKLNAAWVCCGEINNVCWEIPSDIEYILILRFKPSSFYSLFNVSPAVFQAYSICNLGDIVSESWMQVFDKMYEKETISERIFFLDKALSSFEIDARFPHILSSAIDYIEYKKGNIAVSELLLALGKRVSPKWLHRNFVKYIGISPKKYILLQRFIYTYGKVEKSKSKGLLGAALHSGYYDYNHFFKEFKRYIGIAPSHYKWG